MFCSNCGENIDPQAQICARCGAATGAQPNPPPSGATPPGLPSLSAPSEIASSVPLPPVEPTTDAKATISLVLGILSIPLSITCILGLAAGIPAIILGHLSRSAISKSLGRLKGAGMALAGLIMGYISIAVFPIIIVAAILIPNMMKARIAANDAAAAATVRTLITTEITYSVTYPERGYAPDLATLGPGTTGPCPANGPSATHACLLDSTLGCTGRTWCAKDDFRYSVVSVASPATDYVITATPVAGKADKSYCATSDAIVRYKFGTVYAPVTVAECQSWEAQ
jgi:type IV pilus assembly protein PilA